MANMRTHFSTRGKGSTSLASTPQTQAIPGREKEMVKNLSGGYAFKQSDLTHFRRYLITGTMNGTYYATGASLTKDCIDRVENLMSAGKSVEVFATMDEINDNSLAPSKDPILYILAYLTSPKFSLDDRRKAWSRVNRYCKIGTNLLHFIEYMEGFHGWGYAARKAIGRWFTDRSEGSLVNQTLKYRQRDGWAMRDALMLAHPKPMSAVQDVMFRFITTKDSKDLQKRLGDNMAALPELVRDYLEAQKTTDPNRIVQLLEKGLTHEMIPTEALKHEKVWEALLKRKQGLTWLIRNAGNLTRRGVLSDQKLMNFYIDAINSWEEEDSARVHPINFFLAWKFYQAGGAGGKSRNASFTPMGSVSVALEQKFLASLQSMQRRPGHHVIVVDSSGSMGSMVAGKEVIRLFDAALAMSICLQSRYEQTSMWTFDSTLSKRGRVHLNWPNPGGATNMALAIEAFDRSCKGGKNDPDSLIVISDMESYAGDRHVYQALNQARSRLKRRIKMVGINLGHAGGSQMDPNDQDALLINGFDASVMTVLEGFLDS